MMEKERYPAGARNRPHPAHGFGEVPAGHTEGPYQGSLRETANVSRVRPDSAWYRAGNGDDHFGGRLAHPSDLCERGDWIGNMLQYVLEKYAVEDPVTEWQECDIGGHGTRASAQDLRINVDRQDLVAGRLRRCEAGADVGDQSSRKSSDAHLYEDISAPWARRRRSRSHGSATPIRRRVAGRSACGPASCCLRGCERSTSHAGRGYPRRSEGGMWLAAVGGHAILPGGGQRNP